MSNYLAVLNYLLVECKNIIKKNNPYVELLPLQTIFEKAQRVERKEEIAVFVLSAEKKVFLIPYSYDDKYWSLLVYFKESNRCKHYNPFALDFGLKAKLFFEKAVGDAINFEDIVYPLIENPYDCCPFVTNLVQDFFSKDDVAPLGEDKVNTAKSIKKLEEIRLFGTIFFENDYPFLRSASLRDKMVTDNKPFAGNNVKFLLDGEDFFKELQVQFEEVKREENRTDRNTYVRLAYWGADLNLEWYQEQQLGEPSNLGMELRKIADRGVEVKIILWYPPAAVGFADNFLEVTNKAAHDKFYKELNGYKGNLIQVFCEIYNGGMTTSNHQKIAIFSIKGKLRVIIGSMNLSNWYWDKAGHNFEHKFQDSGYGGSIHDTAVLIQGPATLAIEHEWFRRWKKQFNTESQIRRPAYVDQLIPIQENSCEITIATTNTEIRPPIKDIEGLLIQKIKDANHYVYLENYLLSAPSLIAALQGKLSQPNFKLIVMIPHPSIGVDNNKDDLKICGYLNYISYVRIAFLSCNAVTIVISNQQLTLNRNDCSEWTIAEGNDKKWFADLKIHCRKREGGKVFETLFKDIHAFQGGVRFYSPARYIGDKQRYIYIHSKLMLIDDEIAIIGSCNFTYRSMVYDGEIAACIQNPNVVAVQFRTRLFDEFGMTDADHWDASAVPSTDKTERIKVVRLELSDFVGLKELPYSKKNKVTSHEYY